MTRTIPGARTSRLLGAHGFRHAFFTRTGGASTGPYTSLNFSISVGDSPDAVQQNLLRAAEFLGVDASRVFFLSQVHGREVCVLRGDEAHEAVLGREGDAIVSRDPTAAVAVRVADCVPILVGDAETGAALAIHAGWRGVVRGVVERGVETLREVAGGRGRLVAAIGPHITVDAFEVSADVAETLRAASPDPDVVATGFGPKPHVDLARIVRAKLVALGLPESSVELVPGCTVRDRDDFFSFRRDGAKSGRHLAAIVPR
jgi:YfiH family protein